MLQGLDSSYQVWAGAWRVLTTTWSRQHAYPDSAQVNAAGSLTNTLLALTRISQAAASSGRGQPLQLAAACLGGDDALGFFYRRQVEGAGIQLLTEPAPDSHTGQHSMASVCCSPSQCSSEYLGRPTGQGRRRAGA